MEIDHLLGRRARVLSVHAWVCVGVRAVRGVRSVSLRAGGSAAGLRLGGCGVVLAGVGGDIAHTLWEQGGCKYYSQGSNTDSIQCTYKKNH